MKELKQNKAITLIALIITIIVLLILAGVVINMTVGNNGIIAKSQVATQKYKEAQVKEQLEILMTEAKLQAMDEKQDFTAEYFKTYLETKLGNKVQAEIDESGALQVTLDGFKFPVSIVNGTASIGQGVGTSNGQSQQPVVKNIKIETTKQVANDYTKVTMKAEIEYDGILSSIKIGDQEIQNIESKKEGNKYTVEKEVTANGNYEIKAIGEQGKTQTKIVTVDEIEGDLTITSAQELARFRDRVNNGATYEGKTVTLGADIDMSGVCHPASEGKEKLSWIPIGCTKDYKFKGTFDGNYKTISNLYINDENLGRAGLFGTVETGTIKNVVLKNTSIVAKNGGYLVSALLSSSRVENCGSISASVVYSSDGGGLISYGTNDIVINGCFACNINLKSNSHCGGILGGFDGSGSMTNCYCVGVITATGYDATWNKAMCGGIFGLIWGDAECSKVYSVAEVHGGDGSRNCWWLAF